jgi:hypothetical protein
MTTGQFADLVLEMRKAQKEYFKYRSPEALTRSKQLEKQVDEILENRQKRSHNPAEQGTLFGD